MDRFVEWNAVEVRRPLYEVLVSENRFVICIILLMVTPAALSFYSMEFRFTK